MKRGEHISQASFLYGNAVREMRPDSPHFESAVRADVERQHVARVQVAERMAFASSVSALLWR